MYTTSSETLNDDDYDRTMPQNFIMNYIFCILPPQLQTVQLWLVSYCRCTLSVISSVYEFLHCITFKLFQLCNCPWHRATLGLPWLCSCKNVGNALSLSTWRIVIMMHYDCVLQRRKLRKFLQIINAVNMNLFNTNRKLLRSAWIVGLNIQRVTAWLSFALVETWLKQNKASLMTISWQFIQTTCGTNSTVSYNFVEFYYQIHYMARKLTNPNVQCWQ